MDPLSITSGIIAVLQLASSVVSYLGAVKDASDDRQRLIAEIGSITGFLYLLKEESKESSDTLNSLCVANGPLDMFKSALNELASKLRPADGGLKKAGKSLLWPFHKSEVNNLLHRIERLKGMFILALQNDNTQLTRRMVEDIGGMRESLTYVHDTIKQIESNTTDQDRMTVLTWLSPLNFKAKHHDVLSKHHPGTGQWLFDTPEFISWRNGDSKAMWCTGIPGAGKTILASIVIDSLEHELMLHTGDSLAFQLVQRQSILPQRIKDLHTRHATEGTKPTLEEILVELQATLRDLTKVIIVVDALDECAQDKGTRISFLEAMARIEDQVHLLITSRTTANVFDHLPTAVRINIGAKDADVAQYIKNRLVGERRLQRILAGDADLEETIIKTVLRNARGMFLLAQLHLDSLAKKHNRRDIRLALDGLPRELYDTYDEALQRVMSQDEEDVELAK
ncbi:MAG: hypothetical protein Q9195_005352 [Heterodermia aff. obscurata]